MTDVTVNLRQYSTVWDKLKWHVINDSCGGTRSSQVVRALSKHFGLTVTIIRGTPVGLVTMSAEQFSWFILKWC